MTEERRPAAEGLRAQTISGVAWSLGARATKLVLQFVVSVVLARLLTPEDFGLIAMIVVFTGFAGLFTDLGFSAALIQRTEIEERHRNSIFWLNTAVGCVVAALVAGSAPLLADFYNESRLIPITQLIALTFVIGSLNVVQTAQLRREMDFRSLAVVETTSIVVSGVTGIGLALYGFGVYALVWKMLLGTVLLVVLMWTVREWRPKFMFSLAAVRDLLGFSANLLGFQAFNYWVRSFDDLLIGRVVGSHGLGIYSRAYSSMLQPLRQVSTVVGNVMFPALSRMQGNTERVKSVYLRTLALIALITFPMMLGLLVVADAFVLGLYGPKWTEVTPLLRILCVVGLVQSLGTTTGWIYQSQGRTDWMFRWGLGTGTVTLIAIVVGVQWGVLGVVIAYTIRTFSLTYYNFTIPGKLIDMTFREVVDAVAPPLYCAVGMACIVSVAHFVLLPHWPAWQQLLIEVPVGALVYFGFVRLTEINAYEELRELVRDQWCRIQEGA